MEENSIKYFCYFTINNQTQLIVQCVLVLLSLLLVGDAFRKFYKMRGTHNRHVTFVYILLLAWWLVFIATNIYGSVIFFVHDANPGDISFSHMSQLTKYYFVIDWANAFLIQWLLLYLPYQWCKQISDLFDYSQASDKASEIQFTEQAQYKGYETKIYKFLKHYMKVRMVYLVLPIVFLILEDEIVLFKIMVTCLLVDCICIAVSIAFGMISLKTTEQLKQQLDEQESKRTINQYMLVILATLLRFGFDLNDVISHVFNDSIYPESCPAIDDSSFGQELALNIISCVLTYYLPVFIILRIYKLEEKPSLICESLILSRKQEERSKTFEQ